MPAPAPGIAGLQQSLSLLQAASHSLTSAVAKLGAGGNASALAAKIAAQVALITAANGKLQAASPAPAPAPAAPAK